MATFRWGLKWPGFHLMWLYINLFMLKKTFSWWGSFCDKWKGYVGQWAQGDWGGSEVTREVDINCFDFQSKCVLQPARLQSLVLDAKTYLMVGRKLWASGMFSSRSQQWWRLKNKTKDKYKEDVNKRLNVASHVYFTYFWLCFPL